MNKFINASEYLESPTGKVESIKIQEITWPNQIFEIKRIEIFSEYDSQGRIDVNIKLLNSDGSWNNDYILKKGWDFDWTNNIFRSSTLLYRDLFSDTKQFETPIGAYFDPNVSIGPIGFEVIQSGDESIPVSPTIIGFGLPKNHHIRAEVEFIMKNDTNLGEPPDELINLNEQAKEILKLMQENVTDLQRQIEKMKGIIKNESLG